MVMNEEWRFYHLTRDELERVLPALLEKSLDRGWRCRVLAGSSERAQRLSRVLWTHQADSFLPHGLESEGRAVMQPVLIAESDGVNVNKARVLFVIDGTSVNAPQDYALICELFDGRDTDAVSAARVRWRTLKEAGFALSYWQQGEQGGWQNKTPS
jgi:DNA polymerase III subunit chi